MACAPSQLGCHSASGDPLDLDPGYAARKNVYWSCMRAVWPGVNWV
jgi:hypothetical protein